MGRTEPRTDWVLGLSLVQVMLLLLFGVMLVYVTEHVAVSGEEPRPDAGEMKAQDANLQANLAVVTEKSKELEQQLGAMTTLIDDVKLMVGAKFPSKEGFQEAVDTLKRGYALCQKDDNTLIEARIQNGAETVQVIGGIPSDLAVSMAKGDQTTDLEQIVSLIQDVYEYEKDHKCRFNYRLKYETDNDYRKGRDGYEKYFYPEKIMRFG